MPTEFYIFLAICSDDERGGVKHTKVVGSGAQGALSKYDMATPADLGAAGGSTVSASGARVGAVYNYSKSIKISIMFYRN